ncbi:immunity 49 family protein [Otariodibacter oris]|uniref:Immunity protein 49 of polymorphic toxin system n=1 Tax=Otariodibacter oris TaxID=1032623 RepID=A0A420XJB7_9PAST|nr:immunity 49 family protein [Otariodibacter oris]QGM80500.1 hypothetical protein A6A10_03345 [Otariodibacter oris]RKR77349.1 immunity protein 49 of polymorphic toxin system [Otariodibacter oris]
MSKIKELSMAKNYMYYIGSACQRTYQESVEHVKESSAYLDEKGFSDFYELDPKKNIFIPKKSSESTLQKDLRFIKTGFGNPLFCMKWIGTYYEARASLRLLLEGNVPAFKQDAYVGAKLDILGSEDSLGWIHGINTSSFFVPIMSDNPQLIQFLINHRNDFEDKYKRTDTHSFFLKNTLLALAGDWQELKERAEVFLNEPKKVKEDNKRIPDHEFYVALCDKNIEGMEAALKKLLEPRAAKWAVYDNNLWFDFYLQMQVLMYAKIAAIHGFDLDIDSPIAPKELIEYKPLEHYEDPYDFMKEFDYDKPLEDWINAWKEKMAESKPKEELKKKKAFCPWFSKVKNIVEAIRVIYFTKN